MARRPVIAFSRSKLRLLAPAAIEHVGTSCVETASAGWIDRAWYVALQDDRLAGGPRLRYRHRREESLGVGMPGRAEDLLPGRHLDDLAEIHDGDTVRHVLDDRQIVADEEQREAELPLQILQQVYDLRLDGDVESRDRLVADDQFGFRRKCPCDADALALTA